MKPLRAIPDETIRRQREASDPARSAWVTANAGSGKTHVLVQRVIRLLLEGVEPARILCLTYTRAAAANMANRVFSTLSAWTTLPDAELAVRIEAMEGGTPEAARRVEARRLFARALETPGGLKIQTLHAFCESVLRQFPLEANVPAHFQLMDALQERALFAAARRELLTGAMGADHPDLVDAFATVLDHGGEAGLDALLGEILRNRDGLRAFVDRMAGTDRPYEDLFAAFGLGGGLTAAEIAAAAWPLPGFGDPELEALAAAAQAVGAKRVLETLLPAFAAAAQESDRAVRLDRLAAGFLKQDGASYNPGWLFSGALRARMPDLSERYITAADLLIATLDRLNLFRSLQATVAALTIADWLIGRYEQLKAGRGLLDFNDLITRTVRLLARQDAGAWVLYRLDKGVDHILLDEAQDTSPDQWQVVRRIAEEFFIGESARRENRTVFAVADEKQSIYSFQGAAPEAFARTGLGFAERVRGARGSFEEPKLTLSFRSTEDILAAVDRVFAQARARRGLTFSGEEILHTAFRVGTPGYVEVWPSLGQDSVEEPNDWTVPVDHARAPAVQLAGIIAETVRGWLAAGETVAGRPLTAGDIMVLVRKRGAFVTALSRSLKALGIRVAGADRLKLDAHIAVRDLMALGRVALLPDDDLALAAVLRSPIFGLTEDALLDLAGGRPASKSLWQSLRERAATDQGLGAIAARLQDWSAEAAFLRPFEFYGGVLGRDGVRARLVGRLGPETGDVIDEFLNFALAQEQTGLPGLEPFLATLQASPPEIKREMDQTRGEVRIMTVHAAKGLEAPVVFLVDSGSQSLSNQHLPRLLPITKPDWGTPGYLWRAPGARPTAESRAIEQEIRERADDEYRRLLYVGMTRAEDRLILCGTHGSRKPEDGRWLGLVADALAGAPQAREVKHATYPGSVIRFEIGGVTTPLRPEPAAEAAAPAAPVPDSLRLPLAPAPALPRPLAPSGAGSLLVETVDQPSERRSPVLSAGDEPGFALRRGIALHKLLQRLPDLPVAERAAAAKRYLARAGLDWPAAEVERVLASTLAVLDAPGFAPVFATGSRAEVSLMGTLDIRGRHRAVAGKVDRLTVDDGDVLIVDYKTNRPPPESLDGVPDAYVAQLAIYRALLAKIYPDRPVRAALLFTEAPVLIEIPSSDLDAALARLGAA